MTSSTLAFSAPARRPAVTGEVARFFAARLAARTARRLEKNGNGVAAQYETLRQLLATLAPTAFGRTEGLEPQLAYEKFRTRLEPRTYEDFAPYIERMKRGEADVLHRGRCSHFAVSSGTTAGASKWLPVNEAMLDHFRDAGLDSLFFYSLRSGRSSVFAGRHLFLGGSTALTALPDIKPPIHFGDLSGITALNLPAWAERLLYEPGIEIAQMSDWPAKLAAITARTWKSNITMLAGIPSWLLVLAAALRARVEQETGTTPATLRDIWPNLECLVHGGVPIAPFADELRAALGNEVNFHEVYPASEGFIAAQDAEPEAGLRLMVDHGIFYECIPFADFDEDNLAMTDARCVPLEGVQPGVDYVLLMTTPAGLVRYVIGDVVRFVSTMPPRLIYVGRTKLQLSAFGEHVIERELTETLAVVCRKHQRTAANFHVAPLFPDPAQGRMIGRHEWWIELRTSDDAPPPDEAAFAVDLDRELAARNDDYAGKRNGRGLDLPALRLVPAGFFERWLTQIGKWGGQSKTPRCRSDRRVADELSRLR